MLDRTKATILILLACCLAACSGDDSADADSGTAGSGPGGAGSGGNGASEDSQEPAQGADAIEAWLKGGAYKKWSCEPSVHASRAPSPHGFNRICSNALIANNASGSGDWPEGASAVKELYASSSAKTPIGYAVYLKTAADSGGGDNWYWNERVPLDSGAPHDDQGTVADGMGDSGPAKAICVGCHVAAGADEAHTPSEGGRDQVYTPVK
jgi:hypothetical protein